MSQRIRWSCCPGPRSRKTKGKISTRPARGRDMLMLGLATINHLLKLSKHESRRNCSNSDKLVELLAARKLVKKATMCTQRLKKLHLKANLLITLSPLSSKNPLMSPFRQNRIKTPTRSKVQCACQSLAAWWWRVPCCCRSISSTRLDLNSK